MLIATSYIYATVVYCWLLINNSPTNQPTTHSTPATDEVRTMSAAVFGRCSTGLQALAKLPQYSGAAAGMSGEVCPTEIIDLQKSNN